MPDLFFFILMILAGAVGALQPIINANLANRTGILESAFVSFLVGTLALGGVVLVIRQGDLRGVAGAPWWQLTGGFLGAFFVTMFIVAVPRIGTAAAMAAVIASQLLAGVVLDHFGLLGGRQIPVDMVRIAGILLLFGGAALVLRGA